LGNWDPKPIKYQQLSLITFDIDEIVAESGMAIDDLAQCYKFGWLSFSPQYGEKYQPYHLNEVKLIASLVRFGLSKAMISRMLNDLPKPYHYDPELLAFNFFKRKWQQLPDVSEETLRERYFQEFLTELTVESIELYIEKLVDTEDVDSLFDLFQCLKDALEQVTGGTSP